MQISIKPIYDWPIYRTASADERLACIMQTSFHSTTSFMNPFLATVAQNQIITNSLLTYNTGPPYLSYYNQLLYLSLLFLELSKSHLFKSVHRIPLAHNGHDLE